MKKHIKQQTNGHFMLVICTKKHSNQPDVTYENSGNFFVKET